MLEMNMQKKHKILVIILIAVIVLLIAGGVVTVVIFNKIKNENKTQEKIDEPVNVYKDDSTVESISYPTLTEEDAIAKIDRYYKNPADPSIIDIFYGSHVDLNYKNVKKVDDVSYIVTGLDWKTFKTEVLKFVTEEKYNEKNTENKGKFPWTREIDGKAAVANYGASGSSLKEILDIKLNYLGNGEYSCDVVGTWGAHSNIVKVNAKLKYYNNSYVVYETGKIVSEKFDPYTLSEYCVNLLNATSDNVIDMAYNDPSASENSRNSFEYTGDIVSKVYEKKDKVEYTRQYKIADITYKIFMNFVKKYVSEDVFKKIIGYKVEEIKNKVGVVLEENKTIEQRIISQGYELVKMEGDKYTYHINLNKNMVNSGATIVIEKVDNKYIVTSFEEDKVS